jgi:hypothetical protein
MVRLPFCPRPTLILTRHKHKEQKRWTEPAPSRPGARYGSIRREAAIVVLRLGGLIVPTGGPWGWVFWGCRWLPGSVALAPPGEGKDGSGQQPEDSYPAGFFRGDEDDAEGKKPAACSV